MGTEYQSDVYSTATASSLMEVNSSANGSNGTGPEFDLGPVRDGLETVIPMTLTYALLLVTGVIGNFCTCVVITRNKYMHTATNYYLFSLAVSDMLLLISGLPVELYQLWYKRPYAFGEFFCVFRGLTSETSTNASILTITSFTMERYIAICHPLRAHTMSKLSRAIKFIVAIWVVGGLCAIPVAIQFGIIYVEYDGQVLMNSASCTVKNPVKHAFEISTFMFFILPMTLISVLYMLIGLQLRRSSRMNRRNGGGNVGAPPVTVANGIKNYDSKTSEHLQNSSKTLGNKKLSKQSKKGSMSSAASSRRAVLKMLVAVVVAFFICWAPFHAQRLMAIYVTSPTDTDVTIYETLTHISGVSYYVSATINPILYSILSLKFRQAFKETLASCVGRRVTRAGSRYASGASAPRKSTTLEVTDLTMMSESSPRSSLAKVVAFIKPLTNGHHLQHFESKDHGTSNHVSRASFSFISRQEPVTPHPVSIASIDGAGSSISNSSLQMVDEDAFDGAELRSYMDQEQRARQ